MKHLLFCMGFLLCIVPQEIQSQTAEANTEDQKSILAFFAHPDDEGYVAPIFSKYVDLGVRVQLVIVTDGSKGVAAHTNFAPGEELARVRREETECAAATLGINPPVFLDYTDGNLASMTNMVTLDDKIDSLFVRYQPDVVITFGPDGAYGHPDHRMVSNLVTEAYQRKRPKKLKQLFYVGFSEEISTNSKVFKTNTANWFRENIHVTDKQFLTYRVSYSDKDYESARRSFYCHASQFTKEEMDELFLLMEDAEHLIYFRPWNGATEILDDLFK